MNSVFKQISRGIGARYSHTLSKADLPVKVPVHLEYDLHLPQALKLAESKAALCGPLIMLHGLFGSKRNYKSVGKQIARKLNAPVYAVDLRNHGDSPHNAPFDYMTMTEDLNNFIEEKDLRNITIVGHSMGAKVAMCTSLLHPDRIERLVAVDNSPVSLKLDESFDRELSAMYELETSKSVLKTDKAWREKAMKFLEKYVTDANIRLFLISNYTNKVSKYNYNDGLVNFDDAFAHFRIPVAYLHHHGLDSIGDFPTKELGRKNFVGPSLFLKARHSEFINQHSVPLIYHYFPHAVLKTFDTNHWLISEQPEKFIQTLVDFVKQT